MSLPTPTPPPQPDSFNPNVALGLRWTFVRQAVAGAAGTLGALFYTRFLLPEDVGAFGLALLVYSGLFLLVQAPIRDAVIYYQGREGAEQTTSSAAFWLLLGFSVSTVTLVMVCADGLGRLYPSAAAAGLTRGLILAFLMQSLAVVPAALLLQRFNFAAHESLQTASLLLILVGWVALAATGYGPWSLVIPQIIGAAVWMLGVWRAAGFRPARRPGRAAYRDVVLFSRSLFGSKLLTYLKYNIDNAAVGRLGEASLGWYGFGEDQSSFAVVGVGQPMADVALPALAKAHREKDGAAFRRTFTDLLRLAATVTTPAQIGALVLADLGMHVFFGEQWAGAVPVFRAYIAFRLLDALLPICDAATSAIGRPDIRLKLDVAQMPFFALGTWWGLTKWGGIEGVAWALTIVRLLAALAYGWLTLRATGISLTRALRPLLPASLASALMGLAVWGLYGAGWLQTALPDVLALVTLVTSGMALYTLALFMFGPMAFREVMHTGLAIMFPAEVRARLRAGLKRQAGSNRWW